MNDIVGNSVPLRVYSVDLAYQRIQKAFLNQIIGRPRIVCKSGFYIKLYIKYVSNG